MTTLPSVNVRLAWTRSTDGPVSILKRTGAAWEEIARTSESQCVVRGLAPDASHEFAAAALLPDGTVANPETWRRLTVAPMASTARPERPAVPESFVARQDGKVVNFRWVGAADGAAATFEIRVGTSWEDGVLVARDLTSGPYSWPWWSSGTFTFWIKAVDVYGRASLEAANVPATIAALVDHVVASSVDESAGWSGTKDHVVDDGGDLRLAAIPAHFGSATAPFGSFEGAPVFARYWPEGTYESGTINAGQIETERLEVELGSGQPVDTGLPFGSVRHAAIRRRTRRDGTRIALGTRGFAARNSWRVTPLDPVDLAVEIDTAAAGSGDWDGYRPYVPGSYTFWRCRFRVTLRGDGLRYVTVPRLVLTHTRLNKKAEGEIVMSGPGGTDILFPTGLFVLAPKMTGVVISAAAGQFVTFSAITPMGCKAHVWNLATTNRSVVESVNFGLETTASVNVLDAAAFDEVGAATIHWQALGP